MGIIKLLVLAASPRWCSGYKCRYELNDSGSKHPSSVFLSYFISHNKVGIMLFFM